MSQQQTKPSQDVRQEPIKAAQREESKLNPPLPGPASVGAKSADVPTEGEKNFDSIQEPLDYKHKTRPEEVPALDPSKVTEKSRVEEVKYIPGIKAHEVPGSSRSRGNATWDPHG